MRPTGRLVTAVILVAGLVGGAGVSLGGVSGAETPTLPGSTTTTTLPGGTTTTTVPGSTTTTTPGSTTSTSTSTTTSQPGPPVTASPPSDASTARAKATLALLNEERDLGEWQRELDAIRQEIINFTMNKSGLEAQLESMRQNEASLSARVAQALAAARAGAISAYTDAGSTTGIALFDSAKSVEKSAVNNEYMGIVANTWAEDAANYKSLQVQDAKARLVIKAKAAQLATTVPNLSAQEARLTSQITSGTADAKRLGTLVGVGVTDSSAWGLTILGKSSVSADQLAGWWRSRGYINRTGVDITALAQEYLDAGAEAGVRGDVAFAQSVLETAGFSVMSGPYNFAGIGACDSCSAGYGFPSYKAGIRAQIQLLHAYADSSYSTALVVGEVDYHGIDTLSVRGCCPTWVSLTGVWATGAGYGGIILGLYSSILNWGLAHPTPGQAQVLTGGASATGTTSTTSTPASTQTTK